MTKKEFKKWIANNPGYTSWGYTKLSKTSKLPIKEVKKIVKPYRQVYKAGLPFEEEVKVPEIKLNGRTKTFNIPGIHIVLPCVHVPFENKRIVDACLKIISELGNKVAGFHIIGDFLDMAALSSHDKGNIGTITLDEEYEQGNDLLDRFEEVLPLECLKTYIYGNHEDRYFRYMRQVDNSKLGTALENPTQALDLYTRGYYVFEDWKNSVVSLGGHLDLFHGEFTNVHTAKKHLDTYRRSCAFAHTHRKQVFIEGNHGAYNLGSMADFGTKAFGYATRAMKDSWVNSFGVITIDSDGYFNVEIPTLYNNKVVFGGNMY